MYFRGQRRARGRRRRRPYRRSIGGRNSALIVAGIGAATGALIGHAIGQAREDGYDEGRRLPYGNAMGHGMVRNPIPRTISSIRAASHCAVVEDPSTGGRFIKP